ncbi:GH13705 [Drosophila grimshawi]|uniref:GH13705 n=2 Tax=Drosophila grimshawi TaxID=7222 RepID=B4JT51_DROGR|nr:GH13705 [Drosophila grimshawi]
MRSSDASNLDDDATCDGLSETYILQVDDSDASLSPAHTTIVTVRRASAPAVVHQDLNETIILQAEQKQEQQQRVDH